MTRIDTALTAFVLACLLATSALADQILEVNDASLTAYVPTSTSNVQDVRPLVDQRGVNLDGSLRAGAAHRMALAGMSPHP